MPEEKGLGSKLLGLFVERDEPAEGDDAQRPAEGAEKTPAEIVAELAGQSAPGKAPAAAPTAAPPPPPLPRPGGPVSPAEVDFEAVFKGAGMDAAELDRVKKAQELLKSLPEGTPQDVKRQIVEASLKAFGFDVAKIIAAAQNQLRAVDTWVRLNEQQTQKALADAKAQIAQLEDRVIGLKAEMEKKTDTLAGLSAAAADRKAEVEKVLAFFSRPPEASKPG